MSRWMQQLKETYSHMVRSRLLHEGGSLNVGKPGQMGEPMQPAMRPMRPGDDPHQRLAAGRQQLAKDWQEAEDEEDDARMDAGSAILAPTVVGLPLAYATQAFKHYVPHHSSGPVNPFVHQYVDLNGQPKTGQATPAKSTPKSNQQYYEPTRNPNPYGDWDPNKPSNR